MVCAPLSVGHPYTQYVCVCLGHPRWPYVPKERRRSNIFLGSHCWTGLLLLLYCCCIVVVVASSVRLSGDAILHFWGRTLHWHTNTHTRMVSPAPSRLPRQPQSSQSSAFDAILPRFFETFMTHFGSSFNRHDSVNRGMNRIA